MPTTIILRFSDYEIDTIAAHRAVIKKYRSVWWGWWKKKHEAMQGTVLSEIAKNCPLRIGLINRIVEKTAPECFAALCLKVVFDPAATHKPSPDHDRTPGYYRDSKHPAWLEFSAIESLSLEEFIAEFGAIPQGDPTLFVVSKTDEVIVVSPELTKDEWEPLETKGNSILHLSDLHFGQDHGFVSATRDDPVVDLPLETVISRRIAAIPDCTIGVVVVSGDLITRGEADAFPDVSNFLENLVRDLGLEKDHVILVPGNHDFKLQDVEHPTRGYYHEEAFRFFLRGFYGREITEIDSRHTFNTPSGWTLSFVGLNSVRPRKKETKEYGFVGSDRYKPWLEGIVESNAGQGGVALAREQKLNFAILHHHLVPASLVCRPENSRPVSLTLDAGELIMDLQASDIHCALQGHQHIPFVGSTARARPSGQAWVGYDNPLYIIGAGSCGANRLSDEFRNNAFGIYTPRESKLYIQMERFNPSLSPEQFMGLAISFAD